MGDKVRKTSEGKPSSSEKIVFQDQSKDVLCQMNEHRRSNVLCDVIIRSNGREFPAHRAVLASSGGFFGGIFTTKMKEQSESLVEVNSVDPTVLDDILSFIYTGEMEITRENAELVVIAADFLLLEKLKVASDVFMATNVCNVTTDQLVSTYLFAVRYECKVLQQAAKNVMLEKFEAICKTEDFLELSSKNLVDIISNDDLVVGSEEVVFSAVIAWVKHRADERTPSFQELFFHVRLFSLPDEFLKKCVLTEEMVFTKPDCLVQINTIKSKYNPTDASQQQPRSCLDTYTDVILAFPERQGKCVHGPWCYEPSSDTWYHIPVTRDNPTNSCPFGFGVPVYYKGALFLVCSSSNGNTPAVQIHRYDLLSNVWSRVASIPYAIKNFSVGFLNGAIYLVGGELHERVNFKRTVADVVTFNVDSWSRDMTYSVAPMSQRRKNPCVVSDDAYLYVLGGQDYDPEGERVSQQSLERYDPVTNSWTTLAKMKSKCNIIGAEATIMQGKIYITDYKQGEVEDFDEVYDIKTGTWSSIEMTPYPVAFGTFITCKGKLLLIGEDEFLDHNGMFEDQIMDSPIVVLTYDVLEDEWEYLKGSSVKSKHLSSESPIGTLSGILVRLCKSNISSLQKLGDVNL